MTIKRKGGIVISLPTRVDTKPWDFAQKLLALYFGQPRLAPEFVFTYEADSERIAQVEDLRERWLQPLEIRGPAGEHIGTGYEPVNWGRAATPVGLSTVYHTNTTRRGTLLYGHVIANYEPDPEVDWRELFRSLCALTEPKFGMLHLFTRPELAKAPFGSPGATFQTGPAEPQLRKGTIPNLGWGSYFGENFAREVDQIILREQGFEVEKLGAGYLVFITPDLFDVSRDYDTFSIRRAKLKQLFRENLFSLEN